MLSAYPAICGMLRNKNSNCIQYKSKGPVSPVTNEVSDSNLIINAILQTEWKYNIIV